MGAPAAKQGDKITAIDTHIVLVPSPGGPIPTPLPHPFCGILDSKLSTNVRIQGMFAATVGSVAHNMPVHIPTPPGTAFQKPPSNEAKIVNSTSRVCINGKLAARAGDIALTCNDPADIPIGTVIAISTVFL